MTAPGMQDDPEPTAAPRGSLRLMLDPVFGPFFVGKLISVTGIWVYNIVAAILAYEVSRSALVVGMVSVAQFGPQLLLAPVFGALADRGDRKRQLIVGRLISTLGALGLAVWVWAAGPQGLPGAWPVVASALVVGTGFVVGGPAMNALLPSLVHRNELAAAIALNAVPFTVGRAAGPALGALIATSVGTAPAFALAGVTNLTFAVLVLPLRLRSRAAPRRGADRRVRAGVQYLGEDRALILLLIGVAAIGIGTDPVITLTPSLSAGFGVGATLVGVFASSFGIGAGATFLFLAPLRRRIGLPRLGALGLLLVGLGTAAAGLSPVPMLAIAAFVVSGSGMTMALTSLSTQIQARLPDELRGRVMALWSVAFLGSRPLAAAVNGAVADTFSVQVAYLSVGIVLVVAAWYCSQARLARYPPPSLGRFGGA